MDISKISSGKNPPHDVNVIIEIPSGGVPVKYEIDKDSGAMFVDRFLHTAMYYPANYGFVPHTLSADGDPIDVLLFNRESLMPGSVVRCRPIGVLFMEDEAGMDEKLIMVPVSKLSPYYDSIKSFKDLPDIWCRQVAHFFEHYKDLESSKWVKVSNWGGVDEASEIISQAIINAK